MASDPLHRCGDQSGASHSTPAPANYDECGVRIVNRHTVCENSKWTVCLDHIEATGGVEVLDYLVLTPRVRAEGGIAGVAVLPLVEGQLILLHAYRHPNEEYFWEAARGFVDPGEEPEQAALRELAEETGYICAPENLKPLGMFMQEPSTLIARVALFAAEDCQPAGARVETGPGLGSIHSFNLNEAARMAAASEIQDASTLVALYRLLAMQASGEARSA